MPNTEVDLSTFGGRLNYLFQTVHPRGQRPFTNDHVAQAIADTQNVEISGNYVWMLRAGKRDNPTLRHIEALARFFGVPATFLVDQRQAERVRAELDKVAELADSSIQHIAQRGPNDSTSLDTLHALLRKVEQATEDLRNRQDPPREQ